MKVDLEQEYLARTYWDIQGIAQRFGERRGTSTHAVLGDSSASYFPDGYTPTVAMRVGAEQVTIYKWYGNQGTKYTKHGDVTDRISSHLSRYSRKTS